MKRVMLLCLLLSSCGKEGEANAVDVLVSPTKIVNLLDMSHVTDRQYNNFYDPYQFEVFEASADAGMAGVPVLDQGQYGTCVTFATTASLNARYALGDFISQQCSLQLSKTLGNDIWDGAYTPSEVIDPLKKYGVVSKSGCNAQYPSRNVPISVAEYQSRADKSASASVSQVGYTYYKQNNLSVVKQAVSSGKRVLIGFLLNPNKAQGFDLPGKRGGNWSCSASGSEPPPSPEEDALQQCKDQFPGMEWLCDIFFSKEQQAKLAAASECGKWNAGHEVLIYGYDDAKQQLKIRNSWGPNVGDSGNWVMSYEYFSRQVIDQTVVD